MSAPSQSEGDTGAREFTTTHWTVILSAGRDSSAQASDALAKLCRTYWWPLYAFVRRQGHSPHDGQDLTQAFFARLLEKDYLSAVDRSKGKFRSFLLAALEHFLANEWRNAHAQKRGGQFTFVSTDAETAEGQYLQVPAVNLSPQQLFEQQWAMTLLDQTLARLQEEFIASGPPRTRNWRRRWE